MFRTIQSAITWSGEGSKQGRDSQHQPNRMTWTYTTVFSCVLRIFFLLRKCLLEASSPKLFPHPLFKSRYSLYLRCSTTCSWRWDRKTALENHFPGEWGLFSKLSGHIFARPGEHILYSFLSPFEIFPDTIHKQVTKINSSGSYSHLQLLTNSFITKNGNYSQVQ